VDYITILKNRKEVVLNEKHNYLYEIKNNANHFFDKTIVPSDNVSFVSALSVLDAIANKSIKNSDKYILLLIVAKNLNTETFWEKVVSMYVDDLNRIIRNAPVLKRPMTVYRGVKDDYYLKGLTGNVYVTNGFVSTSLDPNIAQDFQEDSECCLKRITIMPGTHVIPLMSLSQFPHEKEILIGSNSKFYVTKAKNFIPKIDMSSSSICPPSMKNVSVVTDIVVIQ
jgi:hypothetical protein